MTVRPLTQSMNSLVCAFTLVVMPGLAQAACTNDLPGRGVLDVFADATSSAVIGGISPNQCGIEVTDFCTNGRCLAFLDGLSGYVDVSGLESGTIDAPPTTFEYRVDAVDGSLSFMGQSQAFEVSGSDTIQVTPAADHVVLSLPDPLPKDIRLTSTGSSGWEAVMPDWVGVPIPVTVYLDRLSADIATLELLAEHQMLKMDMRLTLARLGGPAEGSDAQSSIASLGAETACDATYEMALSIGQSRQQAQIDLFYAAVAAAGIADWDARTEPQCLDLLTQLEQAGIAAGGLGGPEPTAQSCDTLAAELRPILRGADSSEKRAVLGTMVSLGITSIDPTNPKHCAEIAAALAR